MKAPFTTPVRVCRGLSDLTVLEVSTGRVVKDSDEVRRYIEAAINNYEALKRPVVQEKEDPEADRDPDNEPD